MKTYENGHRFINYDEYEHRLHQPYNYTKHGLLQHLMSHKITESKNKPLRIILKFVNDSFVQLLHYIDQLRYFKVYTWRNR